MLFSLAIHGGPESPAARSAAKFIDAALAGDHTINRVFLYHDAVLLTVAGAERTNPAITKLIRLQAEHEFELAVCVGAATRRGIISEPGGPGAPADAPQPPPLSADFNIVGLGQLIDAIVHSDRFITFAA